MKDKPGTATLPDRRLGSSTEVASVCHNCDHNLRLSTVHYNFVSSKNLLFLIKVFIVIHVVHFLRLPVPAVAAQVRLFHWNKANPIFKPVGENVVYVQQNDQLQFICPEGNEMYKIYWTDSRDNFDQCTGGVLLFSCDHRLKFTINIVTFSPDPTIPSFSETKPIYMYTPSTGSFLGLEQPSGGVCRDRNMKISIKIGDPPSTTSQYPTTTSPQSLTPATNPPTTTEQRPRTPVVRETTTDKLLSPTSKDQDVDKQAHTGRRMITAAAVHRMEFRTICICLLLTLLLHILMLS